MIDMVAITWQTLIVCVYDYAIKNKMLWLIYSYLGFHLFYKIRLWVVTSKAPEQSDVCLFVCLNYQGTKELTTIMGYGTAPNTFRDLDIVISRI